MIRNFKPIALIGIIAVLLVTAALTHAQESTEGDGSIPMASEPQASYPSTPDSLDTPSSDSLDASPPDFLDTQAPGTTYTSSPELPIQSPASSSPSAPKTIYISAKDYHPKTTEIKYQVPQSPNSSPPPAVTPASRETDTVHEEPIPVTQPKMAQLDEPKNPRPADGAKGQPLNPMLGWDKVDSDEVTYTVHIGIRPDSLSREYTVIRNSLILPEGLEQATTYYWKVEASNGEETIASDIWSFTTQERPNRPPNRPQDPRPVDGAKNMPINATLSWSSEDPDGDAIEYTVYLSTNSSSEPLEYKVRGRSLPIPSNLSNDVTYYWKVEASDGSLDNESNTWSFTTQSEPNIPPNRPRNPRPDNHVTGQQTNPMLSWDGGEDPDGDPVTFTVYMGPTLNQMSQVYSGPEKNCSAPTSNYGATNFWRVEASDGKLTNSSDVWSFTTKERPVWEQQTTINALVAALIAVLGGLVVNYIKGRKP